MTRFLEWTLLKIGRYLYGKRWSPWPLVLVIPVKQESVEEDWRKVN